MKPIPFAALAFILLATRVGAHEPFTDPKPIIGDMQRAAVAFLNSLTDEQKATATFKLDDEHRVDWHFIPKERKGLAIKSMSPAQRQHAHLLLITALTHHGYRKAVQIMTLEQILHLMENNSPKRDPEKYHVSIFGEPADGATWGWRFEGHHLSLNYTIKDGKLISGTPSFHGANPGEVKEGPHKGLRVLGREEDLARGLLRMLDQEQRKKAIIGETAPADILTSAKSKVAPLEAVGVTAAEMNDKQKAQLTRLIREYLNRHRGGMANAEWKEIEAGFDSIQFAWMGSRKKGEGHYYRVQGKTFLLEYDNTQNNANHPHAVYRRFDGDFGRDLLGEHLKQAHAK